MNTEVIYARPTHHPNSDKSPRPPPRVFTEFQSEVKSGAPDGSKGTFVPKTETKADPTPTPTQAEIRVGLLEQRIERLEDLTDELTEAATKPTTAGSTALVARLVRLCVLEGRLSPENALYAIAQELGIIDESKQRAPAAQFMAAQTPAPPAPKAPAPPPAPLPPAPAWCAAPTTPSGRPPNRPRQGGIKVVDAAIQDPARDACNKRMAKHAFKQAHVAAAAGINQSALSRWLRGGRVSDRGFITKIERALDKMEQ